MFAPFVQAVVFCSCPFVMAGPIAEYIYKYNTIYSHQGEVDIAKCSCPWKRDLQLSELPDQGHGQRKRYSIEDKSALMLSSFNCIVTFLCLFNHLKNSYCHNEKAFRENGLFSQLLMSVILINSFA